MRVALSANHPFLTGNQKSKERHKKTKEEGGKKQKMPAKLAPAELKGEMYLLCNIGHRPIHFRIADPQ